MLLPLQGEPGVVRPHTQSLSAARFWRGHMRGILDAVVIGAGSAGLGVSYFLPGPASMVVRPADHSSPGRFLCLPQPGRAC